MKARLLSIGIVTVFSLLLLSNTTLATNFMDAYAIAVVQPGGNITVSGGIFNTSNSSQGMTNINLTAYVNFPISGNLSSIKTNTTALAFNFNLTAPSTVGNYTVTFYTNDSTTNNKTIPIYVTNITGGSISYTGKYPPFSNGTSFTINVTLLNGTAKVANYAPNVSIYIANGQQVSWNIANQSVRSDSGGVISYNITIPSTASPGQYAIVVEKGMIVNVFSIQTGYIVSVNTETPSVEISSNFAPSSQVMLLAKVKTSAGDATTAPSVMAYVTLPNGTVRNVTLVARNQTTYPGYYNNTFNETSASGQYQIRVDASVGSITQGYTLFNVKTFTASLEPQTDFFMEWGGSSAFGAGQTIGLNIVAVNLSTEDTITVGTGASKIPACNSTYLTFDKVFFTNGTNASVTNVQFSTGQYMMNTICRIQFTGPSASSVYGIRVNLTIGGVTQTAEGYFSIQKYFLKPALVAGTGGEMEFMKMVSPGENVTITLSAYNITSNAGVGGGNITNINVTKITPLMFTQGISEITNLTLNQNYTVSLGSAPTITLAIPSTLLGPSSVEIQASVAGETVRGSIFFISNYLIGFLGPSSGGGMGMPFTSCSGNVTLSGSVMEVKTMQLVQSGSVIANSLHEASEESTGKNVINYITLSANGTSGQGGQISVNLTFSPSYSFSGFYFVVVNATYQGKLSGIPAGFMCKNLNYWPQIRSVGGTEASWRIAPSSGIILSITNVTRLNDSAKIAGGTFTIPRLMNFNPGKGGMKMYTWNSSTGNLTFYLNYSGTGQNIQNNLTLVLSPGNFTDGSNPLQKWPNGFVDMQPTVCTLDNSICDTSFGGFQVVPFDVWLEGFQWGGSISVNSTQSYSLFVKTNVSRSNYNTVTSMNSTNNTAFEINIGRPWEGELTNVSLDSAVLTSDGWNTSTDFGGERWTVNFTIPATISKGDTMISVSVRSYNNESASVEAWATLTKYTIVLPSEEGISNWWGTDASSPGSAAFFANTGINMTAINVTYGIWSKSGTVQNRTGLDSTRYLAGGQQQPITYSTNVKMLLVDRTTAGVYDTIVFNGSGTSGYVNDTNRTLTYNMGLAAGVYFRSIEGSGYVQIVNVSAQALPSGGNWGGSAQTNTNLVIPYLVRLGNIPLPNAGLHVNGVAKQMEQGGAGEGGFGFESRLVEGTNYSYTAGTTDSLGVGFIKVNISNSGKFNVFWKVNTSSDSDIASMSTGTNVEFRAFDSYSQTTNWLPQGKVVMAWANNTIAAGGPVWNAMNPANNPDVYNGSVTETNASNLIRDNVISTWYVVYGPATNVTSIDDDKTNMSSSNDTNDYAVLSNYWNNTISVAQTFANNTPTGASPNQRIAVGSVRRNTSIGAGSNMTIVLYQDNPRPTSYSLTSANENISVVACAKTFDVPDRKPIEGATVRLYTQEWSTMGPPTNRWLTLYDPLDDSVALAGGGTGATPPTSNITTGSQGCVAFKAIYTRDSVNGWPFGCSQVQGTITRGSNAENIWVGWVCR